MTTAEEKKLEFKKANDYRVELYPSGIVRTAWYLREHQGQHLFVQGGDSYIIMNDHWITEKKGVITYKEISSASVHLVSMDKARKKGGIDKYVEDFLGAQK